MIQIYNDREGTRNYLVPQRLIDVAVEIFGGAQREAIFRLARSLITDHFATCERIAANNSHEEAVAFARACLQKSALAGRH